jgi:hypothetical protein
MYGWNAMLSLPDEWADKPDVKSGPPFFERNGK